MTKSRRRLDQLLASLGYGSRREVRSLVDRGHVTVGGEMADHFDAKVDPAEVMVKGQPLEAPDGLLVLFHKPLDCVCTHSSTEGKTIYDLLPNRWRLRNPPATSVGRLDKDTTGVLLITDQGQLVQKWTSPKGEMEKVYEVTVDKPLEERLVPLFASGAVLLQGEEKPCLPAKLEILDPLHARVMLTEGRYHQVRRLFASEGWHVEKLHRSRFGDFVLEELEPGEWKYVPQPGRA